MSLLNIREEIEKIRKVNITFEYLRRDQKNKKVNVTFEY